MILRRFSLLFLVRFLLHARAWKRQFLSFILKPDNAVGFSEPEFIYFSNIVPRSHSNISQGVIANCLRYVGILMISLL